MAQKNEEARKADTKTEEKPEAKANPAVADKGKKLKEDIDKLVDEIDDVLEENAEQFVKNYVQKGGE
jgi:ubiquitin-like protein Pup